MLRLVWPESDERLDSAILKATDRWDRALLIACAGDPEHEPDCPFCARIVERIRAEFRG
jgi:hypothetical protein